MNGKWQPTPPEIADAFVAALPRDPKVERRQMFGYPCAFAGGNMFAGCHENRIIVRLGEAGRDRAAKECGATSFEPMPGRIMKEYAVMPGSVVKSPAKLRRYVAEAFAFAMGVKPTKGPVIQTPPTAHLRAPASPPKPLRTGARTMVPVPKAAPRPPLPVLRAKVAVKAVAPAARVAPRPKTKPAVAKMARLKAVKRAPAPQRKPVAKAKPAAKVKPAAKSGRRPAKPVLRPVKSARARAKPLVKQARRAQAPARTARVAAAPKRGTGARAKAPGRGAAKPVRQMRTGTRGSGRR